MTQAYDKHRDHLEELFQFGREDLDFGIYRIMNHKRDESHARPDSFWHRGNRGYAS